MGEDYTGVSTIELVIFNSPNLGIGTSNISVKAGPQQDQFEVVYTISLLPDFSDRLIHMCLNVSTTFPLVGIVFKGQPDVMQWVHIAEVIFYGSDNVFPVTCPTTLIVPGK